MVFCIYFIIKKHITLKHSDQYEGSVIGYEARNDNKGTTYSLKIEYKDRNLVSHTFVAPTSSNPPALKVGEKVVVFQHQDGSNPDILVFECLYLSLWVWFCLSILATGCILSPYILRVLYER